MAKPEIIKNAETRALVSGLNNENGIALITVLVVLMLLCILGATVLTTSTSELRIVGNYRNLQEAFFSADAAVEFAITSGTIYTNIIPGGTESWPVAGQGKVLDANGEPTSTASSDASHNYNELTISGNNKALVKVDYIETGAVPAGTGSEVDAGMGSGGGFKANYFNVSVIGKGPNNSQTEIESYVARIVPK